MTDNKTLDEISKDKCELEMTPMIDVTFLLLIFFMCTLKFKVLEGKLGAYLPKDVGISGPVVPPLEKVDIRIDVANAGTKMRWDAATETEVPYTQADAAAGRRFFYGEDRRVKYTVGGHSAQDLGEVARRLRVFKLADPGMKATIDAREGTVHKDVVEILDSALTAGFDDITFRGAPD